MAESEYHPLENLRVAILATDGVEQAELTEPRKALEEAGAKTTLVSPKEGTIQAFEHLDKGKKLKVDLPLNQARAADFDAILLPGGALNADFLRTDPAVQEFVRQFNDAQKPMAAICHAPWLLVSAGLVRGRSLTSFNTIRDDIANAGGSWTDQPVVKDKNWVTSRQPDDIPMFNAEMLRLFRDTRSRPAPVPA
jgi:protease I